MANSSEIPKIVNPFILFCIISFSLNICAQDNDFDIKSINLDSLNSEDSLTIEQITFSKEDSIVYTQYLDFIFRDKKPDRIPVNRYFLPLVFDGKFGFDTSVNLPENPYKNEHNLFNIKPPEYPIQYFLGHTPIREKAFRDYLRNNMQSIKYSYVDFEKELEKVEEIKPNIFRNLFSINPEIEFNREDLDDSNRYVPKIRHWKITGNSSLQISQNEISENWSSGGVSNFNLSSNQNIYLNYRKDKIHFNNFIEWKLSFNKNKEEKFRIGEDLFRTYSDFGIKSFLKRWVYSSNLEIKTQLFAHGEGDPKVYKSNFFSPTQINMGILGMKYEMEKKFQSDRYKKINLFVDISPLSLQSKWIFNNDINPTKHGIEEGKKHIIDVGSTLNSKFTFNINRQITFITRFRYFTNYEKVIMESESELKLIFNQFFTTRLFFYGIFDDSKNKHKDLGYFQYNQVLSFGFNYKW